MYPKGNAAVAAARADQRRRAQPALPRDRAARPRLLGADDTFRASIDHAPADGANEFVFYDGPPFANGLPHYGHLLTGYVKDLFPRYQTMRGKQVERRFGWDTHGLPAELEASASSDHRRSEIEEMGIAAFNDRPAANRCCSYTRSGKTTSPARPAGSTSTTTTRRSTSTYMESVIWAFKTALRQGPGLRGLPRAAVLLARRDAAVATTSCGWTTTSTRCARTRRSRSTFPLDAEGRALA